MTVCLFSSIYFRRNCISPICASSHNMLSSIVLISFRINSVIIKHASGLILSISAIPITSLQLSSPLSVCTWFITPTASSISSDTASTSIKFSYVLFRSIGFIFILCHFSHLVYFLISVFVNSIHLRALNPLVYRRRYVHHRLPCTPLGDLRQLIF